ncbi:hypothetical protein B0H14DRAFT_2729967 [Mycena olivaceomarginata]|nr:hypothetical protein B0H14DRAFT_2729967 [Mycena olivaceomarginata]
MGTAGIRRRLDRLVDEYRAEHGGNGLSVTVTGLQLLHKGKVVGSFKFTGYGEKGLSSAAKYLTPIGASIMSDTTWAPVIARLKAAFSIELEAAMEIMDEEIRTQYEKLEKEIMKSLEPASSWTETSASSTNNMSKSKHSVSSGAWSAKTKPSKKFTETMKSDMKVPKTKTIKAKTATAGQRRRGSARQRKPNRQTASPTIRYRMPLS